MCLYTSNCIIRVNKWFKEQQWTPTYSDSDFEKAARQTAYLLINKILFYDVLQAKRPKQLDPLTIPDALTKGGLLQSTLQGYFDCVLNDIDYETIYTTDFIDQIAFPESRPVVEEIKELVRVLKRYDFSQIGFDIIGRIFERLIPEEERHNLGQYFTNPDIVDLILGFCIKHENNTVLDPSCGAGTFLVRAYQHKKLMNLRMPHQEILKTIWGIDIAKFPAHLSTINLAVNDLSVDENYPQIFNEDFFNLSSIEKRGGDEVRKKELSTLGGKKIHIPYPKTVDCIVGNPPYTRQEEIAEITGKEGYKESMINKALLDVKADISKRAGIHAYFFVHGTKFLKDGGRFGFIVSNSWMDVDYGKGIQELFLKNYKIIAIIESKVERWFEDADVNTGIIILERCKDQKERDENLVRFAYLFKPLRHFIPPAHDMWEKQKQRLDAIEKLRKTILFHNDFYQNDEYRIYPKKQSELWEEGFDVEEGKYTGSKWGKYLRAPEIFFKILKKGKDKLVPLKEIADVRFGIKTGANEFFYLTEEEINERGIEKEYWMHKDEKGEWTANKVIVKANELESPIIESELLKHSVLFIGKEKKTLKDKKILNYIRHGERLGFHTRPTCASRKPGRNWYELGENITDIIAFPERVRQRYIVFYNSKRISLNKNLYGIEPHNLELSKVIALALNSTLTPLCTELFARQPGGGGGPLDIDVYVAKDILILKNELLDRHKTRLSEISFLERKTETIFDELGANSPDDVSLDKVRPDRREIDKIIMGDILGLTENEQLKVYQAVVDLVKSRIEKAKSLGKTGKTKEGFDIDMLTRTIKEKLGDKLLGHFYREKILNLKNMETVKLFHPTKEIEINRDFLKGAGWLISSGKDLIECQSEAEAEYLKIWLESGLDEVNVPKDESYLLKILPELKALKEKIDAIISDHLSTITSQKLQNKILQKLQGELFG